MLDKILLKLGFKRCHRCLSLYLRGKGRFCSPLCAVKRATEIMNAERDAVLDDLEAQAAALAVGPLTRHTAKEPRLVYDESVTVSYGLFVCPKCNRRSYDTARHSDHCPGDDAVELHFGPAHVIMAISAAAARGDDAAWESISLNMLKNLWRPEKAKDSLTD